MQLQIVKIVSFCCFLIIKLSFGFGQIHVDTATYVIEGSYKKGRVGSSIISYERPTSEWTFKFNEGSNLIYRKDGSLYMKGTYVFDENMDLVKMDTFHYYYNNGQIRDVGKYKDGKRVGIWKHYAKDGKLEYIQNYENLWRIYFYQNDQKRAEGEMKEMDISKSRYEFFDLTDHDGFWTFYRESGECECKGKLVNDLKHSEWVYMDILNGKVVQARKKYRQYVANYNFEFFDTCKWK